MFRKQKIDVLTVGAGPVGLFTALQLAERNVAVGIIDEEMRTAAHSYALALHPATLRLLHDLDLADDALAGALRLDRIALFDGKEERAALDLRDLGGEFPFLAVLRQSDFERLLEERLRARGVSVQWNHRLSTLEPGAEEVAAHVDRLEKVSSGYAVATTEWVVGKRLTMHPRFVVGADGHHSYVRRLLGYDYVTLDEPRFFAVFEFECAEELPPEVRIVLVNGSVNVVWPLPGGRCRWSFQIRDPEEPCEPRYKSRVAVQVAGSSFPALTEEHLRDFLAERAPWFESRPGELAWSMIVRFESRLSSSFGRDRVWLAGDSGHLTGPVGIQSMNVGLREAHDLADRIARTLTGDGTTGGLERYGEERREEWKRLLGRTARLVPGEGTDEWIRTWTDSLLPCIPESGAALETLARQIGLELETMEDSGITA